MRSRINSTDREKIDASMASFGTTTHADGAVEFQAWIDLAPLNLPKDGEVIVEPYRLSLHERFSFGTVERLAPRGSTVLRELSAEGLKFRVKVVEPNTGRLLARGDRLGSTEAEGVGRRELLKVIVRDLGQEPWRTEFHDDGLPVLVLNDHIADALAKIKTDPVFQALILPGALRQILLMLWREGADESEDDYDDDGRWATGWLRYARQLTAKDKPDWDDENSVWSWIDDVCAAFSNQFNFVNRLPEET